MVASIEINSGSGQPWSLTPPGMLSEREHEEARQIEAIIAHFGSELPGYVAVEELVYRDILKDSDLTDNVKERTAIERALEFAPKFYAMDIEGDTQYMLEGQVRSLIFAGVTIESLIEAN